MPRLRPITRSDRLRHILFERTQVRIPVTEIARVIGKCRQTARNYIDKPETMTIECLALYANAAGITDEEWLAIRRLWG